MIDRLMRMLTPRRHDAEPSESSEAAERAAIRDRMEGCILLGAAGDAMGYVVEFKQVDEIVRQFGGRISFSQPDLWRHRHLGHIVSDDTQMTMFGMEALCRVIEGRSVASVQAVTDETRVSYLQWYETQGRKAVSAPRSGLLSFPEMFAARAPGNTCLSALRLGGRGSVRSPANDSKGCGGVMRVAPFAFLPGVDEDALWVLSTASAALTHGHRLGWASAGALALIIRRVLLGASIREAVETSISYLRQGACPEMGDVLEQGLRHAGRSEIPSEEIESLGGGWVGEECLLIGAVAAMMDADVATRMDVAANHGGDSDSTASVAGQIIGTLLGRSALEASCPVDGIFRNLDVARPMSYVLNRFARAIEQWH